VPDLPGKEKNRLHIVTGLGREANQKITFHLVKAVLDQNADRSEDLLLRVTFLNDPPKPL